MKKILSIIAVVLFIAIPLNASILFKAAAPRDRVPKGAIWPFNDTSLPDGVERFTSADNRLIVGAGNTYSIGETGSTAPSVSGTLGASGDHAANVGGATFYHPIDDGSTSQFEIYSGSSGGNHTHDYSSATFVPAQRKVVLVKATKSLRDFPAKSLLFSTAAQSITENTDFTGKYLQSNTTIENVAESSSITITSGEGGHDHDDDAPGHSNGGGDAAFRSASSAGGHGGNVLTPDSITDNIKKVRLSMWTHATDRIKAMPNMVVMWESLTPPPGWAVCDGTAGNPDLRDCFILPIASGSENTTAAGDNTIDMVLSGTLSHDSTHGHKGSALAASAGGGGAISIYHDTYTWTHTHTISTRSGVSYVPPYYALVFIIKE